LKPQTWPQKELNWVNRTILSTDYDGVGLFSKKGQAIYEKDAQSWLKNG